MSLIGAIKQTAKQPLIHVTLLEPPATIGTGIDVVDSDGPTINALHGGRRPETKPTVDTGPELASQLSEAASPTSQFRKQLR